MAKRKVAKGIAVRRKIDAWARKHHYSKERTGRIRGAVVAKIRAQRRRRRH